jgi:hypothetical protein
MVFFGILVNVGDLLIRSLSNDKLDANFDDMSEYEVRTYSTACYFLNDKTDQWEASGVRVRMNKEPCRTKKKMYKNIFFYRSSTRQGLSLLADPHI